MLCSLRASAKAQLVFSLFLFTAIPLRAQNFLFTEHFDSTTVFTAHGWYDNPHPFITTDSERVGTTGSSAVFFFKKGALVTTNGGGVRLLIPETEQVYMSYWVKYSANWEGSNKPYHPHEFHFMTNQDDKYHGPAASHLTTYIEQNEGWPMLSIQDATNIDETRIGQDLTMVTEQRAVAGCNGDADGTGAGDCYLSGTTHRNGKTWKAPAKYFADTPGPRYKNDWHFMEAFFKLNSIVGGKGVADGSVWFRYDGELVVDKPNVMLRTGAHPTMKFNQFLVAPYIGDGSPVDQTMWIDDLTIADHVPVKQSVIASSKSSKMYFDGRELELFVSSSSANLTVCDLLGRIMHVERLGNGEHHLPLEALEHGVYFTRLEEEGRTQSLRFIR